MSLNAEKFQIPNLDANRFLAFLLVFCSHGFIATSQQVKESDSYQWFDIWKITGTLGVEYFFVLSSFLICFLYFKELETNSNFSLRNFLVRRTLRIWPLYFAMIFIGFTYAFYRNQSGNPIADLPNFFYFATFTLNFSMIEQGAGFLLFLTFLWSIAVEEQFYILLSFLFKFSRIRPLLLFFGFIVVSLLFRMYHADELRNSYFNTISVLGNFGVGGIAAYLYFWKNELYFKIIEAKKTHVFLFFSLLFLSILFFPWISTLPYFAIFYRLYYSILFALFILYISSGKSTYFNLGKSKFLNYLGKISYGLYCFHGISISLLILVLQNLKLEETLWHTFLIYPILILSFTFVLAHLSYRYFESIFLRLKKKFY